MTAGWDLADALAGDREVSSRTLTSESSSDTAAVLPALDGIRAIAILLVIMWHCASSTNFPPQALGPVRPLVLVGWAGVDLFFALSGFLITRLLLQEEAASGSAGGIDLRRFYARRALRILPAYYLVLGLNFLVLRDTGAFPSTAGAGGSGPLEVASLVTYWSNYFYAYSHIDPAPALGVYWSLCVEEHFYLLWPVLLVWVRSRAARLALVSAVCLGLPLLRWLADGWESRALIHITSHYRMDSIMWGALAAVSSVGGAGRWTMDRGRRTLLALLAIGVGAAVLTNHLGVAAGRTGYAVGLSALAALGSLLALETTSAPATLLARGLSTPALRAIGRVSYGMYLLHFQALDLVRPPVVAWFQVASPQAFVCLWVAASTMAFVAAVLLHLVWERPFLRLKSRFASPRVATE